LSEAVERRAIETTEAGDRHGWKPEATNKQETIESETGYNNEIIANWELEEVTINNDVSRSPRWRVARSIFAREGE
jgi:hypothetical protein